jgi:hypothetical protein
MQNDPRDRELSLLILFQKSHGVIAVLIDDKLFLRGHSQESQHMTARQGRHETFLRIHVRGIPTIGRCG